MTAVGALALADGLRLARSADVAGAMTLDALRGTDAAFDPRIHAARPHPGQAASAAQPAAAARGQRAPRVAPRLRPGPGRLQPALHAAGPRRRARRPRATLGAPSWREMNAATDNPLVFADDRRDPLRRQLPRPAGRARGRRAGDRARRRSPRSPSAAIERLVNPALSGLPAFLAREGGLNSGLMMAQVTAAALVSENKVLAHPASVDSIPTSADKEDHVSMGADRRAQGRARRRERVARAGDRAARRVRRRSTSAGRSRSSPPLEAVHALVRTRVAVPRPATARCRPTSRRSRSSCDPARRSARRSGVRYAGVAWRSGVHWREAALADATAARAWSARRAARRSPASGWQQEAALRMLMNNLDPEVAERPRGPRRLRRHRQGRAQLGVLRRDRARAARARATTRRCSCSRASRSASSARTRTRRAC